MMEAERIKTEKSGSGMMKNCGAPALDTAAAAQELAVDRFASMLGMAPLRAPSRMSIGASSAAVGSNSSQATVKQFSQYLSATTINDHDVVCTLPSLDLHSGDGTSAADHLPELGQTQFSQSNGEEQAIPEMAASVLPALAAAAAPIEQSASQHLSATTSWTKSSLPYAPSTISKNIANSFSALVDSRSKEWTLLLLRHSLSTGDDGSRSRLLRMLSSKVELKHCTTSFTTLPLPESVKDFPKEEDVVLPLLFEAVLQVSMQGPLVENVVLRAPGTISGSFSKDEQGGLQPLLTKVDVRLDTEPLLKSLVEQARLVVVKAVEHVTSIRDNDGGATTKHNDGGSGSERDRVVAPASLSRFSSVLSLSSGQPAPDESPSLRKARTSAHRLNEVLQNRTASADKSKADGNLLDTPLSKSRKSRSVTWNHPLEPPTKDSANLPAGKRPKVMESAARLRSFKSFGRPHADDLPNRPRNATFCEFGRSLGNPSIWGRDGKMRSHPRPERSMHSSLTEGGGGGTQNASFGIKPPGVSSLPGLTLGKNTKSTETDNTGEKQEGSFPRTVTALETLLLKSTTSGNPQNSS